MDNCTGDLNGNGGICLSLAVVFYYCEFFGPRSVLVVATLYFLGAQRTWTPSTKVNKLAPNTLNSLNGVINGLVLMAGTACHCHGVAEKADSSED